MKEETSEDAVIDLRDMDRYGLKCAGILSHNDVFWRWKQQSELLVIFLD